MGRRGVHVPVLKSRPAPLDRVCLRHGIWLDGTQTDVNPAPEVIAAFRAYRRFCRRHGADDPVLNSVETVVSRWYRHHYHPVLTTRWDNRLHLIGASRREPTDGITRLVTLPEIITVTSQLLIGRPALRLSDYDYLKTLATRIGLRGPWEFTQGDPLKLLLRSSPR
jgi:hypothetical protein